MFSPRSSVREEDGGAGHAVISPPPLLSQTCPRVHGSGCFLLTFGLSALPDGVSAAASQPPLLGSSVATSPPAGISTFTPPFSPLIPFLPSSPPSFLSLTHALPSTSNYGEGRGLSVSQSEAHRNPLRVTEGAWPAAAAAAAAAGRRRETDVSTCFRAGSPSTNVTEHRVCLKKCVTRT